MKELSITDPLMRVSTLSATVNPQYLCWLSMHQDYSSEPVDNFPGGLPEEVYGQRVVDRCVKYGHWGVLEHPSITLSCAYVPHSVLQQARTHRVAVSFDCQSFRYTSESLTRVKTIKDVEKSIYLRPIGYYTDRKGKKYEYNEDQRISDLYYCLHSIQRYTVRIAEGMSEEHARGMLPFDYRQHFVVTFNARSLLHFCDLRYKADAQLEIQWLAHGIFARFSEWMPEIAAHYANTRLGKGRLAP